MDRKQPQMLQQKSNRHTTKKPSKERCLACKYCTKTFKSAQGLNFHILEHEGKFKYKCRYCGKGYNVKSGYDYHIGKHERDSVV